MSLPSVIYLFPQNTQTLNIVGLQDSVTGSFLDAADALATLYDQRGNADDVLNGIALGYVPGTEGNYLGTVPASFDARLGGGYSLVITAVQSGIQAQWTIPVIVSKRDQT